MNKLALPTVFLGFSLVLSQCSHYAGSPPSAYPATLGYAKPPAGDESARSLTMASIGTSAALYVIGYLFEKADKAITKARTGDYAASAWIPASANFPQDKGSLILLRTVKYNPNLGKVATLGDFINNTPDTAGRSLYQQILKENCVAAGSIRQVVRGMVHQKQIDEQEHIALLVVCPTVKLKTAKLPGDSPHIPVYAVTLDGMYFPVLAAKRIAGESSNLVSRLSKSKESMTLEVFGPNGSGYTTGTVKVPLVWSPPGRSDETAQWVSHKAIMGTLDIRGNDDGVDELKKLDELNTNTRLARRQAFIRPADSYKTLLRAEAHVSETSEATGWISKGLKKLQKEAESLVSP